MELINYSQEDIEQYLQNKNIKKAIIFPDGFVKEKYKRVDYDVAIPSSSVITSDYLMPQMRSRGLLCSMSLIKLNIDCSSQNLAIIEKVLQRLSDSFTHGCMCRFFPFKYKPYDISYRDYLKILCAGPIYLLEKYDIDREEILIRLVNNSIRLSDIPPRLLLGSPSLRNNFGKYFGGNHFIELQLLNRVYDRRVLEQNNLAENTLFLAVHTAGVGLDLVYTFGRIKKYLKSKMINTLDSLKEKRFFCSSLKAIENYSQAYVMNTYIILKRLLEEGFRKKKITEFFTYNPHSSITHNVDYIYRHNAINLDDNPVNYVSGNYNLDSLLVTRGECSGKYLDSLDHGYAKLIELEDRFKTDETVTRILFNKRKKTVLEKECIYNPDILSPYMHFLEETKAARPVASLKPLLNFKQINEC